MSFQTARVQEPVQELVLAQVAAAAARAIDSPTGAAATAMPVAAPVHRSRWSWVSGCCCSIAGAIDAGAVLGCAPTQSVCVSPPVSVGVLMQPPALHLKEDSGPGATGERQIGGAAQVEQHDEKSILCRQCGAEISDAEALFSMDGDRINRVFSNPHGVLHEIITVGQARGLRIEGPPTTDFSWFSGYAWEIAYCDACQSHLGWQFTAVESGIEPERFFGLRRAEIVEP